MKKNTNYQEIIKQKHDQKRKYIVIKSLILLPFTLIRLVFIILLFIFLSLPIYLTLCIRKVFKGMPVYKSQEIIGHSARKYKINLFNTKGYFLPHLSLISHLLLYKVRFVGNSFLPAELFDDKRVQFISQYGYPGIFNLWFIRQTSKIAHEGRINIELEYLANKSLVGDISLILKTFPVLFFRSSIDDYPGIIEIFDLEINNLTMEKSLQIIHESVSSQKKVKLYFVNADCMNKLYKDKEYFSILTKADYIFPDGIGINIAGNILHTPLIENVNGTDMLPFICEMCQLNNYSIFLLGAKPAVADKMKEKLVEKYPNLNIVGTNDGYFSWEKDNEKLIEKINSCKANILLVAFGAPLQEKWIDRNIRSLNIQVALGVGGLFDFYSGQMERAPKWLREIGLEWLFRLIKEPKRMWKRYIIGNPLFIYRVYKWKKDTNR